MEQSTIKIRDIYQTLLERTFEPQEKALVFQFIQNYNLSNFIEDMLSRIEALVEASTNAGTVQLKDIKTMSYNVLKKFNRAIGAIKSENEKKYIKGLLSKFARIIKIEIEQTKAKSTTHIKQAIEDGLSQAVYVEQYDKKDFEEYFSQDYINVTNSKVSVKEVTKRREYLVWNHEKADLKNLIFLLFNEYYFIKSQNDFKTLFNSPDDKTLIKWDGGKVDRLLLLLHKLWSEEYILLKGGNGFWKLIKGRFVDFRNNPFDFNFAKEFSTLSNSITPESAASKELDQIFNSMK